MYRIPYENEQITKTIAAPYAPVDFTEEEKEQFRENIGAGSGGGGRNLLDNPFFTVNQRGATTATVGSGNTYFVDRWFLRAALYTVNSDNTITITSTDNATFTLEQNFDKFINVAGKTLTLSIMLADQSIYSNTVTLPAAAPSSSTKYANITIGNYVFGIRYAYSTGNIAVQVSSTATGVPITIKAIKVEIDNKSTLKNDTPPDYALELTKSRMSTADSEDRYANAIMGVYCQPLENRTGYLDFDDVTIPGFYVNSAYGTALIVLRTGAYGYSGLVQIAIKYNDLKLNIREYHSGVWSAWVVK